MAKVFVYAEMRPDSSPDAAALEILTKARDLGDLEAIVLGPGATQAAVRLGEYGAKTVHVCEDDVYAEYLAQPHVHALAALVGQHSPDIVLFANNYDSRDIAGRLSARLGAPLVANVTDILEGSVVRTSIFGGTLEVDVRLEGSPALVLVRPKSFEAQPARGNTGRVSFLEISIPDELRHARRAESHEEQSRGPKLEQAQVVISGGRGLLASDNFKLLQQLAEAMGNAAVGATRAVVDAGWVPYAMQVGQTGITVRPRVYIAVGISGATQHVVGMKGADNIIAINNDKHAPIFRIADLGVVGDALEILPQLIEEVRAHKTLEKGR